MEIYLVEYRYTPDEAQFSTLSAFRDQEAAMQNARKLAKDQIEEIVSSQQGYPGATNLEDWEVREEQTTSVEVELSCVLKSSNGGYQTGDVYRVRPIDLE